MKGARVLLLAASVFGTVERVSRGLVHVRADVGAGLDPLRGVLFHFPPLDLVPCKVNGRPCYVNARLLA
jgi:hypothetical protein